MAASRKTRVTSPASRRSHQSQRAPILVMGCSLLIACCIAFGGANWLAAPAPVETDPIEQDHVVEPGYYQETIGSYEAISQSEDAEDALLVDFLVGKVLNDDVTNSDDTFALPKGTEITREIALDAKKHDALLLLTMSVD